MDWEAEWNELANKAWVWSPAGRKHTNNGSGLSHWLHILHWTCDNVPAIYTIFWSLLEELSHRHFSFNLMPSNPLLSNLHLILFHLICGMSRVRHPASSISIRWCIQLQLVVWSLQVPGAFHCVMRQGKPPPSLVAKPHPPLMYISTTGCGSIPGSDYPYPIIQKTRRIRTYVKIP